jgi:hypothetical protein
VEGEFNSSALLVVCRAVHAGLDGWPVDEVEGGWCPVFALSYVESKLCVLGAVLKVGVDFAAVGFSVDKEVGGSGWGNWWGGGMSCSHV